MKFIAGLALVLALTGCGQNSPLNLSKPSSVERGEADAINPARNIEVNCETKSNITVTTNITNNCNKNNATAEPFVAPAE